MSVELAIVKAMLSHQTWLDYAPTLDWVQLKAQSPEIHRLMLAIKAWHEKNNSDLQVKELAVWVFLQFSGMSDKQKAVYQDLIKQMHLEEVRQELIVSYMQQLKDTQIRHTLAVMAIDEEIPNDKLLTQAALLGQSTVEKATDDFVTTDLDELLRIDEDTQGFTWRLQCLNKSLGVLKKGMFGVILARVETGKTAMWVSEVGNFAGQINDDEHICVFFNEENGTDVMWRLYSSVTGMTALDIECNPAKAKELWVAGGGKRIKFLDSAQQKTTTITRVLDTLNPKLIIIDNLDKIKGTDSEDRKDAQLGKIYQWARETAKTYAPVIGVSQASAPIGKEQQMWLTELDMADSKTAKPAELDFLIAIGRTDKAGYEFVRYVNIPKNKRRGNRYTKEADRHGKFQTIIVPELSIYKDA